MNEMRKKRILIVDDDPSIIELLGISLDMAGYEVLAAGDGAQAVISLQKMMPDDAVDVIMVDLLMPVMDGLRFVRWLRTEMKSTLPVLALTGMSQSKDTQAAMSAGADAVLSKPVDPRVIIKKLAELLEDTASDNSVKK